jgi:hypothetical protein
MVVLFDLIGYPEGGSQICGLKIQNYIPGITLSRILVGKENVLTIVITLVGY